jgi:L-rhamnonate dehydratase
MTSATHLHPLIKSVKAYTQQAAGRTITGSGGADCHDVEDSHWINGHPTPIANPMSVYRKYAATRKSWGINALGTIVVCIEDTNGNTGVGVSIGGEPGKDLTATESVNHARREKYSSEG